PTASRVVFDTSSSTPYQIVVDGGYPFTEGHISLQVNFDSAPLVLILSPLSNTSFPGPAQIPITARGGDLDGRIHETDLFADSFGVATNYATVSNHYVNFVFPNVAG